MSIRSRALIALAVVLVPSGCGYVKLPQVGWPSTIDGRPVALLMEGTAFDPAVRAETANELESEVDRPVRVVDAFPAATDDATKALAARVVGARSLRYDWREPQCAWDRTLLAGLTHDADAVYRAVLDRSEHERPATDEEWEDLRGPRLGFRRLRERPLVREEVLTGALVRSTLVAKDAVSRVSLDRRRVTLAGDRRRIEVDAVVAEAAQGLGPLPAPEWDALARRQLKQGCPFLALAIADTQLAADVREPVQTAAIGAMRPSRPARERTEPAVARAAAPDAPAPPAPAADPVSCQSLCEMHMVEICNSDKVLWSAHRARWESTPCGTRREEPFLAECYREQWDTGTFETSCVQPCESSEAGRSHLMAILREAGCAAGPGPS